MDGGIVSARGGGGGIERTSSMDRLDLDFARDDI